MAATPFLASQCCHIHHQNHYYCYHLSPFLLFFSILSFCFIFYLYSKLTKKKINDTQKQLQIVQKNLSLQESDLPHQSDPAHLTHSSILLEILPSNSPKWPKLFGKNELGDAPNKIESIVDAERVDKDKEMTKKKKRAKKKRTDSNDSSGVVKEKEELVCLYPFTKSSSATQRKIKQHYDELVKSHEANALTLAQVGQFVNCLVEARNELQHKSEVIQRRFTITKALLFKADRSSFVRLRQQIYKLELEHKRLEEDAFVYNWLQQQLKRSPAYKKMLEIGADLEMKAKSNELVENTDAELPDISFEELLAQEKKDAFWQRNGRTKVCSG